MAMFKSETHKTTGMCVGCGRTSVFPVDSEIFVCQNLNCKRHGLEASASAAVNRHIRSEVARLDMCASDAATEQAVHQARLMQIDPPKASADDGASEALPVLRIRGLSRVAGEPRELSMFCSREPTDDEFRRIHDLLSEMRVVDGKL